MGAIFPSDELKYQTEILECCSCRKALGWLVGRSVNYADSEDEALCFACGERYGLEFRIGRTGEHEN